MLTDIKYIISDNNTDAANRLFTVPFLGKNLAMILIEL